MAAFADASLNAKLPAREKEEFCSNAEALGLSPSAAIRVFVRKFNECGGFPFSVRRGYPLSDEERREIAQIDRAIDSDTARTYSSFSEVLAEVDAEIREEGTRA